MDEDKFSLKKFFFGGITRKIIIIFMIFAVILILGGTYYNYIGSKEILTKNIYNHLETTAQSRANHIETLIKNYENEVKTFATGNPFKDVMDENIDYNIRIDQVKRRINSIIESHSEISRIRVLDKNGIIIVSSHEDIGKDVSNKSIFLKGKQDVYVEDVHISEFTGNAVLNLAYPIFLDNKFKGILIINLDIKKLNKITTDRTGLKETGDVYLINEEGYMITPSRFLLKKDTFLKQKVDTLNSRNCFADYEKYGAEEHEHETDIFLDYRGKKVLGTHNHISKLKWCLLVEIEEVEAIGIERNRLLKNTFFIILIVILLAFLISLPVINWITNPIKKLHKATEEVEKGNFKIRIDIKTGDELEQLGLAFNKTAEALEKMDEEHKQVEKSKTQFLTITSHELRSPMTPMKAQLEMLIEGYFGKLNIKQKESLDIIVKNTNRLDKIIVDFLDISRLEAARLRFEFKKTDLTKVIKEVVGYMKGFMPEKKIEIITKISKLPIIEVDANRLNQILRNLINNAIKFSPKNSKIFVEVKLKDNMILFSVKDQGVGISPENQKRIFEPFFQVETYTKREHGGSGLGLSICRGIIKAQNGNIWVESKVGKGSIFYFTIPLKPVREIQPIKILFSSQEDIKEKIKIIFKEILGPIGINEFEELKNKGNLKKEDIFKYINNLINKGILNEERSNKFKNNIKIIFGEKVVVIPIKKRMKRWIDKF